MNSHLKTAHDFGVKKALEKHGYASIEDVKKDVDALGLIPAETPKTAEEKTLEGVFASLKAKLGG